MKITKACSTRLACALALTALLTSEADASKKFVKMIPNGGNVPDVPAIGHPDGTGKSAATNTFGDEFSAAGNKWTKELCEADTDGDGQTNGQELGDPCCEWDMDTNPVVQWTDGVSHPDDASKTSDPSLWANLCGASTVETTESEASAESNGADDGSETTAASTQATEASESTMPSTASSSSTSTTSSSSSTTDSEDGSSHSDELHSHSMESSNSSALDAGSMSMSTSGSSSSAVDVGSPSSSSGSSKAAIRGASSESSADSSASTPSTSSSSSSAPSMSGASVAKPIFITVLAAAMAFFA